MKNSFLVPAATALLGFSIAWIAKPAASAPAPAIVAEATPKKSSRTAAADPRTTMAEGKRPKEVHASDFPLTDQAEKGPKNREEAKMLRLTEALGLTIEQQGEIIQLIEDSRANISADLPAIDDLTKRGKIIEDALAKLLSPEQLQKFNDLRVRERDNQIEARAQKALTQVIDEIDLSPQQRDEVMERLRQSAKADLQSIPASASLLFEKSVLPTGKNELSVDGVLMLSKMAEPVTSDNLMAAHEKVVQAQRQELEDRLKSYDGILTPAQMGQFYAAQAEQKALLNRMPTQPVMRGPQITPDPNPEPEPEPADGQ